MTTSSYRNAGQTCICTNRVFVHVRTGRDGGIRVWVAWAMHSNQRQGECGREAAQGRLATAFWRAMVVILPACSKSVSLASTSAQNHSAPCLAHAVPDGPGVCARRLCEGAGGSSAEAARGRRHGRGDHPRPAHPALCRRDGGLVQWGAFLLGNRDVQRVRSTPGAAASLLPSCEAQTATNRVIFLVLHPFPRRWRPRCRTPFPRGQLWLSGGSAQSMTPVTL